MHLAIDLDQNSFDWKVSWWVSWPLSGQRAIAFGRRGYADEKASYFRHSREWKGNYSELALDSQGQKWWHNFQSFWPLLDDGQVAATGQLIIWPESEETGSQFHLLWQEIVISLKTKALTVLDKNKILSIVVFPHFSSNYWTFPEVPPISCPHHPISHPLISDYTLSGRFTLIRPTTGNPPCL